MHRLGALALFAVGLDHLEQYSVDHYSAIHIIGTLFVVNFVAATAIAYGLATPPGRLGPRAAPALRMSGIAVAAGSLMGLYLSEHGGLFGFSENGYRPAILLAIGLELAAIVGLAWTRPRWRLYRSARRRPRACSCPRSPRRGGGA